MKEIFSDNQKDFICRKLAQFIPHRQIAAALRERYPELELTPEELLYRVKYYSASPKAKKWQQRIDLYRSMLETNLKKEFALSHRFKRLRLLEKIVDQAAKPRLAAVFATPAERDEQGRLIYSRNEIYKSDYALALKALSMINRELADAGLSDAGEKLSNLTDEQLRERIELRDQISAEFGPIQLDQEEQAG